jgi:hypothetical protein
MYKVQNLTNKPFGFQGKTVAAYSAETYPQITDYISLSRLANSGKARYFIIPNPVEIVSDVKAAVVTETKEVTVEAVEDTSIPEIKENVVEETKVEEVKEEKVETTETKTDKYSARKGRNKRKFDEE